MADEQLVKSRRRVADHGEVFTPRWLVDDMLDLVESETERIDSRFLEPGHRRGGQLTAQGSTGPMSSPSRAASIQSTIMLLLETAAVRMSRASASIDRP